VLLPGSRTKLLDKKSLQGIKDYVANIHTNLTKGETIMNKTNALGIFVVLLLVVGLSFVIWQSVYVNDRHFANVEFSSKSALFETANESIATVNQNIKEAKSNLDELLSMKNFQDPVKSLMEVKYLTSAEMLFVSAERITISGMSTTLSQIPLKDRYPLDLSNEIFSVCNTLSGEQGSAIDVITNDIYAGKFDSSDIEYLKKLDALLGKLTTVLEDATVYKDTQGAFSNLKAINKALIELAEEKAKGGS